VYSALISKISTSGKDRIHSRKIGSPVCFMASSAAIRITPSPSSPLNLLEMIAVISAAGFELLFFTSAQTISPVEKKDTLRPGIFICYIFTCGLHSHNDNNSHNSPSLHETCL
jgi:hypothetical protein